MASESIPFEGVEKRLVIQFATDAVHQNPAIPTFDEVGRIKAPVTMSATEWQSILNHATCSIVSERTLGSESKVYLLSESTLYVWKTGFLLKTCGRTTPFLALQAFMHRYGVTSLEDLSVSWMTYSRLDFLHPKYQVFPHRNFGEETEFLSNLTTKCKHTAIKAGDHTLFAIFASPCSQRISEGYSLEEVLMTGVRQDCVRQLTGFNNHTEQQSNDDGSSERSTLRRMLHDFPHKVHDEFWFEPHGYSANVLVGNFGESVDYFSTHISPEPVTSYASLELGSVTDNSSFEFSEAFPLSSLIAPFRAKNLNITRLNIRIGPTSPVVPSNSVHTCGDYVLKGADSDIMQIGQYICEVGHLAFVDSLSISESDIDESAWLSREELAVSY